MHRHGYKGRKFRRQKDERRALIKGLASNLIEHGSITTTTPKAKELVPYFEKLITKAKKGDLHNRRLVIKKVANVFTAHKLVDEIAPKLTKRNSGHVRVVKEHNRRGDNAQMATVSFVDDVMLKESSGDNLQKINSSKKTAKNGTTTTVLTKAQVKKQATPQKTVATHTNTKATRAKGVTKGDR